MGSGLRASVLVLQRPPYHGDVMGNALRKMGYQVFFGPLENPGPGDVMVTWNRHKSRDEPCKAHEAAGGTVLVVENGYFGRNFNGSEWYALSRGQHNGAGWSPPGNVERWQSFKLDLKPWKTDGQEIVMLVSRGMGSERCAEPPGWAKKTALQIAADTGLPVRVRPHPGPQYAVPPVSLEDDLRNAWAAVTWGSTAGLKALALGVPVIHGFSEWIGAGAAVRYERGEIKRFLGDRIPMFSEVATAMWSIDEIASGKAFECHL